MFCDFAELFLRTCNVFLQSPCSRKGSLFLVFVASLNVNTRKYWAMDREIIDKEYRINPLFFKQLHFLLLYF